MEKIQEDWRNGKCDNILLENLNKKGKSDEFKANSKAQCFGIFRLGDLETTLC